MDNDHVARQWARVDQLLDQVLARAPHEREAFVQAETAHDPRLRSEVMALLAEFETRGDLLDRPAMEALTCRPSAADLQPGHRVGAYRVLSLLGRGGMGEVYLGERADGQFEHHAALKLLRHDAVDHLGRFIAERRILARLRHPGIARLYDAGVTDDGRPYMVMELVQGVPITQWCLRGRASLQQRLGLFTQVCGAVAYAHQNLVIHRDLKPGNILVDEAGEIRLLDFGVARLLAPVDSSETVGAPITPAYAAPEQLAGGAVTTATDVHALGLLLFELLTDARARGNEQTPLALMLDRVLREDEPIPSRFAGSQANAPVESRRLKGDLDAIVAKALRREPGDRYATVAEMQADVLRHQRAEPVAARGGAGAYVLGRFLRRYRLPVAAVGALILALSAGMAGTAWQAREAARERDIARTEAERSDAVRDYVMLMFREAGEDAGESELTAKQVLERSAQRLIDLPSGQDPEREEIYQLLGELFAAIDDFEGAAPIYRRYLETPRMRTNPALQAEIRHDLAVAEYRLGEMQQARDHLAQAQRFWNQDPNRYRESLASSRVVQSQLLRESGHNEEAIASLRAGLAERIAASGRGHRETAYMLNALGLALMNAGKLQDADRVLGEALQILVSLGRQDSTQALSMLSNQGVIAAMLGDNVRAEPLLRRAMELRRQLYGRSAALAVLQQNVGRLMVRSGNAAQARPLLEDSLEMAKEFTGPASPMSLTVSLAVVEAQIALKDAAADPDLERSLAAIDTHLGSDHVLRARGEQLLARLRLQQGRRDEAGRAIDSAERKIKALGPAGAAYLPEIANLRNQLADGKLAAASR
jgi:non-specific serine/threonine protein kinase/serine/threonine-protein kinase